MNRITPGQGFAPKSPKTQAPETDRNQQQRFEQAMRYSSDATMQRKENRQSGTMVRKEPRHIHEAVQQTNLQELGETEHNNKLIRTAKENDQEGDTQDEQQLVTTHLSDEKIEVQRRPTSDEQRSRGLHTSTSDSVSDPLHEDNPQTATPKEKDPAASTTAYGLRLAALQERENLDNLVIATSLNPLNQTPGDRLLARLTPPITNHDLNQLMIRLAVDIHLEMKRPDRPPLLQLSLPGLGDLTIRIAHNPGELLVGILVASNSQHLLNQGRNDLLERLQRLYPGEQIRLELFSERDNKQGSRQKRSIYDEWESAI